MGNSLFKFKPVAEKALDIGLAIQVVILAVSLACLGLLGFEGMMMGGALYFPTNMIGVFLLEFLAKNYNTEGVIMSFFIMSIPQTYFISLFVQKILRERGKL